MKSFRIKNIKSFLDSGTIEIAPITIFVGENSCGKSSLLRFPAVLAQTMLSTSSAPIVFSGRYVDYGFFENVIHAQSGDTIEYDFSYDVDINSREDLRFFFPDEKEDENNKNIKPVKMDFIVMNQDKKTVVKSVSMFIENKKIVEFAIDDKRRHVKLNYIFSEKGNMVKSSFDFDLQSLSFERQGSGFPDYDSADLFSSIYREITSKYPSNNIGDIKNLYNRLFVDVNPFEQEKLNRLERKIKIIKYSFDRISDIMSHVYVYFQDEAFTMNYIGPFREAPARIYRDSESSSSGMGVGVRGENVGNILIRDSRRKGVLLKEINQWIRPTLGYSLSLKDMNNGFYQIILDDKQGNQLDISDVGFGISQVLPIVTQVVKNSNIAIATRGRKIEYYPLYIEQPELHLHPAAQSKLANLFAKCIENNRIGTYSNIVIETHSEHLIRKLQVLISDKNSKLTNDMVKIYYVDKKRNGNAFVKEMRIAQNGKFETEWPTGFFDQGYNATMDLLRNTAEEI